ncbi:MAG: M48 family metallopeptidase [Candidatus Parcubacteria bacterium]|nr:M48 family metallopeptidase [Candidatus Parcubacteria bacterium]
MYQQIDSNKRKTVLLIVIFIAFILLLGWLFGYLTESGYLGLGAAIIISTVMTLISYYAGDKVALSSSGAREITHDENKYVYHLVENLCITAGTPLPKIYIIDDPNINAFATGRDPQHASIALTQGAIDKLTNEELEGVIAHELSHVKNYDIRLMMVVLVLVGVIALLADWLMRGLFHKGDNNKSAGIFIIVGIVIALLTPLIAELIKLAISRKREYLADADGSLLTRYPQGLANALEKIGQENVQPLKRAHNATAHLYIANPFGQTKKFLSGLFSTHPPLEDRIAKLRGMA